MENARAIRVTASSQSLKRERTIMNVRYKFTTDIGKTIAGFYKTASLPAEEREIPVVYDPRMP
jgi:hypothetical protein